MPKHDHLGFVRAGTAVPRLKVANCDFNAQGIIDSMVQAEASKVKVLVFPELSIAGYTCADLFHQATLREGALSAVARVLEATVSRFSGIAFVGCPLVVRDRLYNCAIAMRGGKILGVVPKSFLPNYKEFYERRWFSPAADSDDTEITLFGQTVPFGADLLFAASDVPGLTIGVEICEDLWVPIPPSSLQVLAGATMIVNLSASNELIGKEGYRRQLVFNQSARCMAAYVYASCGSSESSTDVVFSGHCLIAENGIELAENRRFEHEAVLLLADVDLDRIAIDRLRGGTFADNRRVLSGKQFRIQNFKLEASKAPSQLARRVEAHPFVPAGKERLNERCQEIFHIQVAGLTKRLEHVNPEKVSIGVSGGLDSTLALLVLVKAFQKLGWKNSRITGLTMPGFGTTKRTKGNAHALMEALAVNASEIDIRGLCFAEMKALGHKPFGLAIDSMELDAFNASLAELPAGSQDLVFENVQARQRTSLLMNSGFTIGTGDVSELALGWCTYNADHMSMYNPNVSIPKTLVRFLVKWAAENEFDGEVRKILLDVAATEISPELLPAGKDGKIAQKTESSVGPYELTDFFLYNLLRFGFAPEKILYLAEQAKFDVAYSKNEVRTWLKLWLKRFFFQQYKRSCLPDGPKVGSISLSPRGDWRMPTDADPSIWLKWAESDESSSKNGAQKAGSKEKTSKA
jgi:NAD+ synthase (glutamine-hydrolysing)